MYVYYSNIQTFLLGMSLRLTWKGKKVLVAAMFLGTEKELAGAETRWLEGDCHSPRVCSSASSVLSLLSSSSPEMLPGYTAFLPLPAREFAPSYEQYFHRSCGFS